MLGSLILLVSLLLTPTASAQQVDLEEEVRKIATELRCVVCQNLSVADSPSELAQQMRGVILEQLKEGKSPEQIKAYFVSKYGEWVLLAPTPKGFNLLVWVLPFVAVVSGILLVFFVVRRWTKKKNSLRPMKVDPALIERVQREAATERPLQVDIEPENPQSTLLREQARLYADLKELEFDHEAGKLSQTDYHDLRQGLETQAAIVLKELDAASKTVQSHESKSPESRVGKTEKQGSEVRKSSLRSWQLAGGVFLLLFGVTLGVVLTKSLRPRLSETDNITGDFLTGTGPTLPSLLALLAQGRAAFEQQEWSKAIDAFKKILANDANHSEANSYMGLILAQAGHADGALLAFDRALSSDPNFPLALWGKGMLLLRAKEDFAGAREMLERLVSIMPPGPEKEEVQRTIGELGERGSGQRERAKKAVARGTQAQIQGIVSIDPKLKTKIDGQAVLFIIARSPDSGGGPPLAVKKVERPVFPVSYSLGPENVMIPGVPFSGKVIISARLDKDGNPLTREPGNLIGEYKNNPVEVGSQKVDIVIDQAM
ncbi:MAG: cytochrome c-type biogenesis protein CcmH [Candidatus Binatia bacterium]